MYDAGIEADEDGIVVLSREFSAAGRSIARLNHSVVPLSAVRSLAENLIDLHGQYAHQTILRRADQSGFLDATGSKKHRGLVDTAAAQYRELKEITARLQDFRDNRAALESEAELLKFRLNEMDGLISSSREYDTLKQDIKTLEHGQDLDEAVNSAYACVSSAVAGSTAMDAVARALHALRPLRGVSADLDAAVAQLEEADALLDTAARSLGALRNVFESNPARLDELQNRFFQIRELMKKTDCGTIHDLFHYREKSLQRLDSISLDEDSIKALEKQAGDMQVRAAATARKLSESRRRLAQKFSRDLKKELKQLAMPGANFRVDIVSREKGLLVSGENGDELYLSAETGP